MDDRDKKITENIGLVHSIANRFRNRGADYDDLFQAGCVGLIKAVDNFDESKGFAFSTYAVPVIMGEIKRIFRDGGAIKISRSLKEKSIKVQAMRDKFLSKNLREPTVSELASLSGYDVEELSEILNIINPVVSINMLTEEGSEEIDIPVDDSDKMFDRLSLEQVMTTLTETERLLIEYRFYQGKTQCETAKILNVSQVQVSRKEKAILLKMRNKLDSA
ncbi:MAG: flagellar biosynthesis protein FliA [Clostridiales bacterium 41_12_two_minus]|nr:MAG: flagellar biosynthesis protein FliA [Clostridiales bacterium 41_12_two_minus]